MCSEVFIFRFYLSPIACVALLSFSKGVPHILEEHDFFIQSIINLKPFVSHENGILSMASDSKNSNVGNAQQMFDEMPKMIVHCSNSLFVEFKIVGILNVKELLSYEFVFNGSVVVGIQFIYEIYDQLRWITCCSCVFCRLISKKRSFIPCFKFVLSHFVLHFNFLWNAHHPCWFYDLNNQGDPCDDYDFTSAYSLGNLKGSQIFKCLNGFELMIWHEHKRVEWPNGCVKTHWQLKYCKQYQSNLAKLVISRTSSSIKFKGALGIWSASSGAIEHNYYINFFINKVFTLEHCYAYLVNLVSSFVKELSRLVARKIATTSLPLCDFLHVVWILFGFDEGGFWVALSTGIIKRHQFAFLGSALLYMALIGKCASFVALVLALSLAQLYLALVDNDSCNKNVSSVVHVVHRNRYVHSNLWLPRYCSKYVNSPWDQVVQLHGCSVCVAALDSCPIVGNGFTTIFTAYIIAPPMSVAKYFDHAILLTLANQGLYVLVYEAVDKSNPKTSYWIICSIAPIILELNILATILGSEISTTHSYVFIGPQHIIFQNIATQMQTGQQWSSGGALFGSTAVGSSQFFSTIKHFQFKQWDPGIF